MEIRNNTPSFGMAFVKPAAEHLPEFTRYVIGSKKPKLMARGLKQIQKAHEADKYVDIVYLPNKKGFKVVPQEGMASVVLEKVAGKNTEFIETQFPTRLEQISEKIEKMVEDLENSKTGKLKKGAAAISAMCRGLIEAGRIYLYPKEILPANLRAASNMATRIERSISRDVANTTLIDKALK